MEGRGSRAGRGSKKAAAEAASGRGSTDDESIVGKRPFADAGLAFGRRILGPGKRRYMTQKELEAYGSAVHGSNGFDVPSLPPGVLSPLSGNIVPGIGDPARIRPFVDLAIAHNKRETGEDLELVEIIKWNSQAACAFRYYITFTAREANTGSPPVVYQALVLRKIPPKKNKVSIFRRRPEGPAAGEDESENLSLLN